MPDWLISVIAGAIAGGITGFLSAYSLERLRRRWQREESSVQVRLANISRARLPLEKIRDEIVNNQGFYFTKVSEEHITGEIRAGIYGTGDKILKKRFLEAVPLLRELAWGSERRGSGQKCLPH